MDADLRGSGDTGERAGSAVDERSCRRV